MSLSEVALCRVCRTPLEHGNCPACKRRAARFKDVLEHTPPPGLCVDCGAPTPRATKPGGRSKKRCPLCTPLFKREVYLQTKALKAKPAKARR